MMIKKEYVLIIFCLAIMLVAFFYYYFTIKKNNFLDLFNYQSAETSKSRWQGPTSANTPQEMFEYLIQRPIPEEVKDLQAVGDTWQGYSIFLRFTTSEEFIQQLLATGFTETSCEDLVVYSSNKDEFTFNLPAGYDQFNPPWNPLKLNDKKCYEKQAVTNDWTHLGSHYLILDFKLEFMNNLVYFYGIGS